MHRSANTALCADEGQYTTPRRQAANTGTLRSNYDTYSSRRYQYRSRSDLGVTPRRYASQTLLDGARPGPPAHGSWRRDALESLQRELDTLSRSPVNTTGERRQGYTTSTARGYSSDTGYANENLQSRRQQTVTTEAYGVC